MEILPDQGLFNPEPNSRPRMVEGYFKPSLVLRGDLVARQFFDGFLGPVRRNGDPQVSIIRILGNHMGFDKRTPS